MDLTLILLYVVLNLGCVLSELTLRFVFITEAEEADLGIKISRALKSSEQLRPEVKTLDTIIRLDRELEDDSFLQLCSSISQGISLIIDLSWSPWARARELAAATGVPLVHSTLGSQQLVRALDNYLEMRNATDAALILESEADVDRSLYTLLGSSNVRVWAHAGLTRDSARTLKYMRPEPSFYAIIGESNFIMDSYRRAVKEKLVRLDYRWNLVFTDYGTPPDLTSIELPTTILTVDSAECCRLTGQREECSCPSDFQKTQFILNSLMQYITETYYKLERDLPSLSAKIDCENLEGSMNMNETSEILYRQFAEDAEVSNDTLFYWDGDTPSLLLRSRFHLSTYTPGQGLQTSASWSAGEEFKLLPGIELPTLRMFFRVGTAPSVPWAMHKLDPQSGEPMYDGDGQPIYEGYCIDLIAKLAEAMAFDYELVTPKVGTFGKKLPNGSWDGIVGDLTRGETDFAIASLTMTAEREEVVDFVAPYFEQTGILIVIRKPTRKTSLFKFMTVLRTEVWLSIVAALVLTGFMIWILDKYSPYSAKNNAEAYPYPCREFTLKESFWFALTSFTPQGGGEAPKALSGRTLVAAYWLFVVLMLATFTANLAAFLTVERMQTPVSSLEQLARQSRINYTVVEGSTIHEYFINMKFAEDTLYRVWKEITLNATSDQAQYRVWDYPIREQYGHILLAINASGPVPDAKTGFTEVNTHTDADFAFIHDSSEIRYEVTRNCNLTEVGDVFAEQPYAIAVQQGSRLQEELSRALLNLQKERYLEQLANKYWNESARQACPDADESEGITLESLGGVFIATLFGLGLAMITLAWEIFYYKRKEKAKVQNMDIQPVKQAFEEPKKKNLLDVASKGNFMESVARLRKKKGKKPGQVKGVTIGESFKPVRDKISYINVFPKNEYRP